MQNKTVSEELKQFTVKQEDVRKKTLEIKPSQIIRARQLTLKDPQRVSQCIRSTKGKIPDKWKHPNVTAIFKKGDRNKPNNYRPVSLTCIICKIMESLIRDQVMSHMKNTNYSVTSNLASWMDNLQYYGYLSSWINGPRSWTREE